MKKVIGIIGGMGPQASAYMYKTLIDLAILEFHAINNNDFPEILLYSVPVPDFISSKEKKKTALNMLKKRVQILNKMDLACLSIACNTAHMLLDELQSVSVIPFISMIDAVVTVVVKDNTKKVGLLGTPSMLRSKMYQKAFSQYDIKVLTPDKKDFSSLENIIRNVIKGIITKENEKQLVYLANKLKKRGSQGIVLGCTELPLVFPKSYSIPVYNSVEILSRILLQKYYN